MLRVLGVPKSSIRRMRGKGNVLNKLKSDPDEPHIGLVDRDRRAQHPVTLAPFQEAERIDGLALYTWKQHRLVEVDDRIEDWIMAVVSEAKLDLKRFHLPIKDADELHRLEMQVMDIRLANALKAAIAADNAPVRTMKRFLQM